MEFNALANRCYNDADIMGWNVDIPMAPTDSPAFIAWINSKLFLVVSEVVEAGDELRMGRRPEQTAFELDKNNNDKPIGVPSELADIIIRTLHLARVLNIDIYASIIQKLDYNLKREFRHGGKLF